MVTIVFSTPVLPLQCREMPLKEKHVFKDSEVLIILYKILRKKKLSMYNTVCIRSSSPAFLNLFKTRRDYNDKGKCENDSHSMAKLEVVGMTFFFFYSFSSLCCKNTLSLVLSPIVHKN